MEDRIAFEFVEEQMRRKAHREKLMKSENEKKT